MLRGRFLNGLLLGLGKRPFGESRRCGDLKADLRIKLPASGKFARLREKESRGKCPLDVAADTGLTSGDGVMPAMIGGRMDGTQGGLHSSTAAYAATILSTQRYDLQRSRESDLTGEAIWQESKEGKVYVVQAGRASNEYTTPNPGLFLAP